MSFKITHIQATFNGGRPLYSLLAARMNPDGSILVEETIQKQSRNLNDLGFELLADIGAVVDAEFKRQATADT